MLITCTLRIVYCGLPLSLTCVSLTHPAIAHNATDALPPIRHAPRLTRPLATHRSPLTPRYLLPKAERDAHRATQQLAAIEQEAASAREATLILEVEQLREEVQGMVDRSVLDRERGQQAASELTVQLGVARAEKEAVAASLAAEVHKASTSKRDAIDKYDERLKTLQADKDATAARMSAKLKEQQQLASDERTRLENTCERLRAEQEHVRQQSESQLRGLQAAKEDETQQLRRTLERVNSRRAQSKDPARGRMLDYSANLRAHALAALASKSAASSPQASPAASPRATVVPTPPATARTASAKGGRTLGWATVRQIGSGC